MFPKITVIDIESFSKKYKVSGGDSKRERTHTTYVLRTLTAGLSEHIRSKTHHEYKPKTWHE